MLDQVVRGTAPFVLHEMGWDADFINALRSGGRTATSLVDHLAGELIGCGDLAILVERERYLRRVAKGTVATIWSLDDGLNSYA